MGEGGPGAMQFPSSQEGRVWDRWDGEGRAGGGGTSKMVSTFWCFRFKAINEHGAEYCGLSEAMMQMVPAQTSDVEFAHTTDRLLGSALHLSTPSPICTSL